MGLYTGTTEVIAALMLLLEFGMLRQALIRDQVRLYAAQSALISVLAIVIASTRNLPDLYALAGLSAALKVVAVPWVLRRLLPSEEIEARNVASAVLVSIALGAFGFFAFGSIGGLREVVPGGHSHVSGPAAPETTLALAGAMVFVAFGLMILRRDVASQAVGFFTLENAISLAALVLAAGLPLILETAFLFDLLVAVVVFGMLMRAHHAKAGSLSTAGLTRLRG